MKIWFLTGEFAPDFGGGIGTYVENCAKMFAEAGDDVTVIVRTINGDKVEKAKEGYRIVRFQQGEGEAYQYLGYDNALAYQYYEVIMKMIDKYGKPDIIEMQEYNAYGQYIIQNKNQIIIIMNKVILTAPNGKVYITKTKYDINDSFYSLAPSIKDSNRFFKEKDLKFIK